MRVSPQLLCVPLVVLAAWLAVQMHAIAQQASRWLVVLFIFLSVSQCAVGWRIRIRLRDNLATKLLLSCCFSKCGAENPRQRRLRHGHFSLHLSSFPFGCFRCLSPRILLFLFGQRKDKLQSAALVVFGRNAPTVDDDSVLHDGQSQPCSAKLAGTAFVYPVEAFKEAV